MIALQDFNKVVVLVDGSLHVYSIEIMARVCQNLSPSQALEASMEKISGQDSVSVFKAGTIKNRTIGMPLITLVIVLHLIPIKFAYSRLRS